MSVATTPSITSPSSTVRRPVTLVGYAAMGLAVNSTGRSATRKSPVRLRAGSLGRRRMPKAASSRSISGTSASRSASGAGSTTDSPDGVMPCPGSMRSSRSSSARVTSSPCTTPLPAARPRSDWRVRK